MPTYNIAAGIRSRNHQVPAGATVTIVPAQGATATVEYTTADDNAVANGATVWQQWPNGLVQSQVSDRANDPMWVRVTSTGGVTVLTLEYTPTQMAQDPFRKDWASSMVNTGLPTISSVGPVAIGQVLTAVPPPGVLPSGYQWYRDIGDGNGPQAIATNGTGATYTRVAADVAVIGGKPITITVVVTSSQSMSLSNVSYPAANSYPRQVIGLSMPFGDLSGGAPNATCTWRVAQTLPRAFVRVRAYLFNQDTANPATGQKASISVSESFANGSTPTLGGVPSNATWQNFLFSGSPTVTLPVGVAGSAYNIPSITVSDWLTLSSTPRTDTTGYPAVYSQIFNSTSGAAVGFSQPGVGYTPYVEGIAGMQHRIRAYVQNGDWVANPAGFTSNSPTANCIPMALEFQYADGTRSVLVAGDSTVNGTGNTANAGAAIIALGALDAAADVLNVASVAMAGQRAADSYTKIMNVLALHKPSTVYFQPFSVNDTLTYADAQAASQTRADNMVAYCAANGINLVLETPKPIVIAGGPARSGAETTALAAMETYFLGKVSGTVKCLDLRFLHDPTKRGVWLAQYDFDNYHPNNAGHTAIAALLNQAIQQFGKP